MKKSHIRLLLQELNHGLIEREDILKTALLSVLAGENLLLIGPPGTGKSMIARRIAERMTGEHPYFEYLLTKFSTPEEIFGPLSIAELKADRFRRNTSGYLPSARIAFLDEIFKASSSILNALLTILNERLYHNGTEVLDVPLQAMIAASNELPADQEELSALYDRFLTRSFVTYVSEASLGRLFERTGPAPREAMLTVPGLQTVRAAAAQVHVPDQIVDAVRRIWIAHKQAFKEDARERLSDRRLKKAIHLLCVSAATNERDAVDLSDVVLLKDCLWNHPDNALKVRELVLQTLRGFSRPVPASAAAAPAPAPAPTAASAGTVLRGFRGSGTPADPFLVEGYHHLMDLTRAEVGAAGYAFRQVADIDCGELTSWMEIAFQGQYDGGGHRIAYRKCGDDWRALFKQVRAQSSVRNLKLLDLHLASDVTQGELTECSSNISLVKEKATGSTILHCAAGGSLVDSTAVECTIACCRSRSFLVRYSAQNCTIRDCIVDLDLRWATNADRSVGGIASDLSDGSIVERCFVGGRLHNSGNGTIRLYGIAHAGKTGVIRHCAVGRLDIQGSWTSVGKRIGGEGGQLENNASIDTNEESHAKGWPMFGQEHADSASGRSVAPALFKQHFFEHTLGWDFDTVWRWDADTDQPALRSGHTAAASSDGSASIDLLIQQIRANIWL